MAKVMQWFEPYTSPWRGAAGRAPLRHTPVHEGEHCSERVGEDVLGCPQSLDPTQAHGQERGRDAEHDAVLDEGEWNVREDRSDGRPGTW